MALQVTSPSEIELSLSAADAQERFTGLVDRGTARLCIAAEQLFPGGPLEMPTRGELKERHRGEFLLPQQNSAAATDAALAEAEEATAGLAVTARDPVEHQRVLGLALDACDFGSGRLVADSDRVNTYQFLWWVKCFGQEKEQESQNNDATKEQGDDDDDDDDDEAVSRARETGEEAHGKAGDAQETRVRTATTTTTSKSKNNKKNRPTTAFKDMRRRTGKSVVRKGGASYRVIVSIFVPLVQKLGLWEFNIAIEWPDHFDRMTSWLKFPAIGWKLALNLPDLKARGWLYWLVLVLCVAYPVILVAIVARDDGMLPTITSTTTTDTGGGGDNSEILEEVYKKWAWGRATKVSSTAVVAGAVLAGVGAGVGDGQVLGLGCIFMLFGAGYHLWEYLKLHFVLEQELSAHDRKVAPAYRAMRVFVCSTVFLLVLMSIYIMSVSALCQTIMDAVGKPKRATELAFAAVLVGPVTLAPPVGLWFALRRFLDKHNIERLPEAKSGDEYRGWLERFADREVGAPMWETAVASLVLSFAADKGAFAVVQLLERALATIVATCLVEETAAQLGLAIAIEAGCMVAEYVLVRSPTCTCK